MPIYVYRCDCGAQFEEYKSISEAGKKSPCKCGKEAKQIIAPAGYEPWQPFYSAAQGRYFESRESYNNYCKKKGLDGITATEHRIKQEESKHYWREKGKEI